MIIIQNIIRQYAITMITRYTNQAKKALDDT